MAQPDGPVVRCPHCNKAYRWKPELGGKMVRCKCTQKFRVPTDPAGAAEPIGPPAVPEPAVASQSSGYDLDAGDDPSPTPPAASAGGLGEGRCPSCGSKINPGAVICLNCGFNLKENKRTSTQVTTGEAPAAPSTAPPTDNYTGTIAANMDARAQREADMAQDMVRKHRFDDIYLPLILAAVGIFFLVLANMGYVLLPHEPGEPGGLLLGVIMTVFAGVRFVIQIPLLLIGIFIVAQLFGSSYGRLGPAMLKLMAVALCMNASGDTVLILIYFMTGGLSVMGVETMISLGASLVVFFCICAKLFDMDGLEALVFWLIIKMIPWAILIFLGPAIAAIFA